MSTSPEPFPGVVERGVTALVPFVEPWKLPLNPEDLSLMAYAVLKFALSDMSQEEIVTQVGELIARAAQDHQSMLNAMAVMRRVHNTSRPKFYDQDKEG